MTEKKGDQENEKADSVGNEAELIGRIIQSEQKLTEYFTTIITKSVTEQIERRNMTRLRVFGIISVVVVSLMIPAIALWVRAAITNETEVAIQEQFSDAITQLEGRFGDETEKLGQDFESFLSQERLYITFANYALYLTDRSHVREDELKKLLEVLQQIEANPDLTARPDFPFLVDLMVVIAIRHGYADTLEVLQIELQKLLVSSPRTVPRLTRYYGESIVGDRFISVNRLETVVEKFRRYLDLSANTSDYGQLLALQLMVESKLDDEGSRKRLEAIQLYIHDLMPEKQASFIAEIIRYSKPDYRDVPTTARNKRIAITAGEFVVEEARFFNDMLKDDAVHAALTQLASYQANLENAEIATALSAFRRVVLSGVSSGTDMKLQKSVRRLISGEVNRWLGNSIIVESLIAQNAETGDHTEHDIKVLEGIWQEEFTSGQYDLISEVLDQPVSRFLKRVKINGLGTYHEIHLMDGVGLLVGASDANEDYWQADEPKWQKTYPVGQGALHIGDLLYDPSALTWEIQVSLPVFDPLTQETIGAITIGIDPSALN